MSQLSMLNSLRASSFGVVSFLSKIKSNVSILLLSMLLLLLLLVAFAFNVVAVVVETFATVMGYKWPSKKWHLTNFMELEVAFFARHNF